MCAFTAIFSVIRVLVSLISINAPMVIYQSFNMLSMHYSIFHHVASRFVLVMLLLFFSPLSVAEEDEIIDEPDAIVTSFPLRLTAQWWDQLGQARPEDLKGIVEKITRELNLINKPEEARGLASQVTTLLVQYESKRNTPLPVKEGVKNEEKRRYYLDDVFQLLKQEKSIESDIQLIKANYQTLLDEIQTADMTLNKIKLDYLKNKDADTNQLIQGLSWMEARLNLSLLGISEKSMTVQMAFLNDQLKGLFEERQQALGILEIPPKEVNDAKHRSELLKDKIKTIKVTLQTLKDANRAITSTEEASLVKKRMLSLDILLASLTLKSSETENLIFLLIQDIHTLKSNTTDDVRSNVKKSLHAGLTYAKETKEWLVAAGDRVEKEENAFNNQKALEADAKAKQQGRERKLLLDKVSAIGIELEAKTAKLTLLTTILDDQLGKTAQGAAVLVERADQTLRDTWRKVVAWMGTSLFKLSGTPVTPMGLLHFLAIVFIGWFISRVFSHAIEKVNTRTKGGMQASSIKTLTRIARVVFISISLLVAFSTLGIDVTKFALIASALSIGIGFGLQNIINNFVSGIILVFERRMKVGDYIELADGIRGEVREINIRSTVINTNNNIDVIVPNSEFVNSSVTNWTMSERFMRLKIPFGVAYGSDKELVRRIITEAALALPYTLNLTERQYPQVRLASFGDSSLDFELVVWVKAEWANRPGRVRAAYNWEIETMLGNHNVEIPFPQRDVRVLSRSVDGLSAS